MPKILGPTEDPGLHASAPVGVEADEHQNLDAQHYDSPSFRPERSGVEESSRFDACPSRTTPRQARDDGGRVTAILLPPPPWGVG